MTRTIFLLLISALLIESASAGGPWPRKRDSGYLQLGFTYLGYSKFFDHEGGITELPRSVTEFTSQVYLDYGLTDRLSFTAALPFRYAATGDRVFASDPGYFSDTTVFRDTVPAGKLFGMSTVLMGFKYCIINKHVFFSAGLNAEANVAKYDSLTTLRAGPSTFVIHPYLSVGTGFGKFYTFLDAGYRLRTNNYRTRST